MDQERRREVRVSVVSPSTFSSHLPAPEQDRGDTTLGAPLIPPDAAAEAESGFGPLKTLLGTISSAYADRQVRLRSLSCNSYGAKTSRRDPSPSETRSKCSSHASPRWTHSSRRLRVMWKISGAGVIWYGMQCMLLVLHPALTSFERCLRLRERTAILLPETWDTGSY